MKRVLVIGAGWAGLAAAIHVTQAGHHATVLEAARAIGGRARALNVILGSLQYNVKVPRI